MGRQTTRTESAPVELMIQMDDYLREEHTTYAGFHARYLPSMSYATFNTTIKGAYATAEVIDAICEALDTAQREQMRRDRKTCPHCKAALD